MLKKYKELKYNYLITMESNNEEEPNPEINVNTIVINNSDDLLRVFMERFTQQMNTQNLNPQFIDNVLQRSFEEDKVKVQRCTQDFINSIETKEIVDEEYTCSICMDTINKGENYISLPCSGTSHHFHEGNEHCDGIKKWLELNNTCPICRTEFPGEDLKEEGNTEGNTEETDLSEPQEIEIEMNFSITHDEMQGPNIMNMVNQTLQNIIEMEEENMLQMAIQNSLEPTPTVES